MAKTKVEDKSVRGVQMQATVPHEMGTALENWGWDNRKLKTAVVRQALEEFIANHGIQVEGNEAGETEQA